MSEPDYLTVYLYAHEMVRKDIVKMKDEVELWKLRSDNWQKYVQLLQEEINRLKKAGTEMGKHLPDTDEANKAYDNFENGGQYK